MARGHRRRHMSMRYTAQGWFPEYDGTENEYGIPAEFRLPEDDENGQPRFVLARSCTEEPEYVTAAIAFRGTSPIPIRPRLLRIEKSSEYQTAFTAFMSAIYKYGLRHVVRYKPYYREDPNETVRVCDAVSPEIMSMTIILECSSFLDLCEDIGVASRKETLTRHPRNVGPSCTHGTTAHTPLRALICDSHDREYFVCETGSGDPADFAIVRTEEVHFTQRLHFDALCMGPYGFISWLKPYEMGASTTAAPLVSVVSPASRHSYIGFRDMYQRAQRLEYASFRDLAPQLQQRVDLGLEDALDKLAFRLDLFGNAFFVDRSPDDLSALETDRGTPTHLDKGVIAEMPPAGPGDSAGQPGQCSTSDPPNTPAIVTCSGANNNSQYPVPVPSNATAQVCDSSNVPSSPPDHVKQTVAPSTPKNEDAAAIACVPSEKVYLKGQDGPCALGTAKADRNEVEVDTQVQQSTEMEHGVRSGIDGQKGRTDDDPPPLKSPDADNGTLRRQVQSVEATQKGKGWDINAAKLQAARLQAVLREAVLSNDQFCQHFGKAAVSQDHEQSTLVALKTETRRLKSINQRLIDGDAVLHTELTGLYERHASLQAENIRLVDETAELDKKHAAVETEHKALACDVATLKAENTMLVDETNELRTELAGLGEKNASLQTENNRLIDKIAELEEKNTATEAEHIIFEWDVASLKIENTRLVDEINGLRTARHRLDEEIATLLEDKEKLRRGLVRREDSNKVLTEQLSDLKHTKESGSGQYGQAWPAGQRNDLARAAYRTIDVQAARIRELEAEVTAGTEGDSARARKRKAPELDDANDAPLDTSKITIDTAVQINAKGTEALASIEPCNRTIDTKPDTLANVTLAEAKNMIADLLAEKSVHDSVMKKKTDEVIKWKRKAEGRDRPSRPDARPHASASASRSESASASSSGFEFRLGSAAASGSGTGAGGNRVTSGRRK